MGYYAATCLNKKCLGPAIFWSTHMFVDCSRCRKRLEFMKLLARREHQLKVKEPINV